MKNCTARAVGLFMPVLGLCGQGLCQWSTDPTQNLAIADLGGDQVQPKVRRTADGGCYVSWLDNRSGGYDTYLQRLDAAGNELLGQNGVLVVDTGFSSTQDYGVDVDPSGNAVVAYRDDRLGVTQIGVNVIAPDGALLWGPQGVRVTNVSSAVFLAAPHVAATTDGFYIVAWTQDSTAIVQKVSASGMPQWGDPGIVLTPSGGGSYSVSDVVASDSGSAIVGLVRTLSGVRRTHTQKFSADGAQQWGGGSPVVVMDTTSLQQGNFPPLMSDGAGGALYWWYEVSGVALQCRVQHLDSAGAELFPHNGAAAATQAGRYRVSPTIAYLPDGQTTIMFWTEENTSQSQWGISAQKFNGVGARQWTDNGVTLVPLSGMQNAFLRAVPYADGAMVFGFDRQNAAQVIGIRVDGAGTQVWAGSPIAACSVLSSKSRLDIAQATDGGALLAWSDGRNDGGDIYAQRVNPDGTLGPSPCRADFNQNGVLNSQDFFDFISAFFMGGPTADFNGDATVNSQDFFDYLTAFFAGCA